MKQNLRCPCGRDVTAGRTAGSGGNTKCLICQTNVLMATFRDPMTAKTQKKRKEHAHATS